MSNEKSVQFGKNKYLIPHSGYTTIRTWHEKDNRVWYEDEMRKDITPVKRAKYGLWLNTCKHYLCEQRPIVVMVVWLIALIPALIITIYIGSMLLDPQLEERYQNTPYTNREASPLAYSYRDTFIAFCLPLFILLLLGVFEIKWLIYNYRPHRMCVKLGKIA